MDFEWSNSPTMSNEHRILMIAPTSFFLDYGCHVRILEEARALLALGQQVRIVTYYLGRDWPGLEIVRSRSTPWRAEYEVGSSRHKIVFDVLLSWQALLETLRWKPDIIHGHLHEGALIGSALARLARIPIVFDFQGSLTGEMLDHNFIRKDTLGYYWWRRLEERIVEMPDAVIASTTQSVEILARDFNRKKGVHSLPDSVNPDFFKPDCITPEVREHQRAKLGVPQDRQLVVYLGLLADYQGIPQLLEAAARLRVQDMAVSFLIMGFPGVEYYRECAYHLGLKPADIVFTGKIPYEQAPNYLALGDLSVAPKISATEGSGKILNYMATSLPVVAYDTKVSREYLDSLGTYALPVGGVGALAEAIKSLLDHPDEARSLGSKLRDRACELFSWEDMGSALMRIYQGLWEST
jgi:glycosyltransferase involved in cell wall biosynthesis